MPFINMKTTATLDIAKKDAERRMQKAMRQKIRNNS